MKKILSVLLAVVLMLSCFSVVSFAKGEELVITVANDLHYAYKTITSGEVLDNGRDDVYYHSAYSGQLLLESEAIIDEFLERAAQSESTHILLPGDLVHEDTEPGLMAIAEKLMAFEEASGKSVFVVPGNHDLRYMSDKNVFKQIFYKLGYDEAIAYDENSASYVAELNSEYRLIAIDSTTPGAHSPGIDEERAAWIELQAKTAQQDGKKLIAMMHHNLMEHFIISSKIYGNAVVDLSLGLAEIFAEYNVKYTFSGHTHDQDITSYTGKNGNVIYDVVTNTLNAYPVAYRQVTFSDDKVKFETKNIDSIDVSKLDATRISEKAIEHAANDFSSYAKVCYEIGLKDLILNVLDAEWLIDTIGLDREKDSEMCEVLSQVLGRFTSVIEMPLYAEDGEESIEALAKEYGTEIPVTEYETMLDVAAFIYSSHNLGDEQIYFDSDEIVLAAKGVAVCLNYALSSLSGKQYAEALSFAASLVEPIFGYIPIDFLSFAGNGIKRFEGCEIFVTYTVSPFLSIYATDDGVPDNNAVLPGYETSLAEQTGLSLIISIKAFLAKVYHFVQSILRYLDITI